MQVSTVVINLVMFQEQKEASMWLEQEGQREADRGGLRDMWQPSSEGLTRLRESGVLFQV